MEIAEIDKKTLISLLKSYKEESYESGELYAMEGFSFFIHLINNVPTIKHEISAKWTDTYRDGYKPGKVVICSNCNQPNYEFDKDNNIVGIMSDYCPYCGAKMDLQKSCEL